LNGWPFTSNILRVYSEASRYKLLKFGLRF